MNLKSLAESLGLSTTTVSRALNGYPDVSAATRERVCAAAQAQGYAPNTRALSLATGRAMAIGHVIPGASRHEIVNPIFADFVAGAGETYGPAGYEILLSVMPEGTEEEGYRRLARSGRVDGLVLQAPRPADRRIDLLTELNLPFVVHGRATEAEADYSWLDMDNRRAFARATRHLTDLGHRRIALLNGPADMDFAIRRAAGFHEAMEAAGLAVAPEHIRHDQMTEFFGYAAAREMLAADPKPTAFVTAALLIALGVRRAVEEQGLRMGGDVSVVTHDDGLSYLTNGAEGAPLFTATHAPVREMGRATAAMLLTRIAAPDAPPAHRMMPANFVLGPSSGPAPA
ncbi:MAG: substrate-binding domain-containing protein [Pseudomonadota bacterium]